MGGGGYGEQSGGGAFAESMRTAGAKASRGTLTTGLVIRPEPFLG